MLCMQFLSIFLQANEIQVIVGMGKGSLVKIMQGWCSEDGEGVREDSLCITRRSPPGT